MSRLVVLRGRWARGRWARGRATFEDALARLGDQAAEGRRMLAALAWARGPGFPEAVWLRVAAALTPDGDGLVSSAQVAWLARKLDELVARSAGPSGPAYQVRDAALATSLRAGLAAGGPRDARAVEAVITAALLAAVPDMAGVRDWPGADGYVRARIAEHAAAAGPDVLAAVLGDVGFLAVADPAEVDRLLDVSVPQLRTAARVFRRAQPLLGKDSQVNATCLAEADQAVGTGAAAAGRMLYRTRMAAVAEDDECLLTIAAHTGLVNGVTLAATPGGGLLLASCGDDATVRVWDYRTGEPLAEPMTGHTGWINEVTFGVTPDGRQLLASCGLDCTVRVWNPITGALVTGPITGHTDALYAVRFGTVPGDGRLLLASAAGRGDRTIRLWDPLTGTALGAPLTGHTGAVNGLAFAVTRAGRMVLASAGGTDWVVRRWDPLTGEKLGDPMAGHTDRVIWVASCTCPDGRPLLASCSKDRTIRVWDAETGEPVGKPLTGHTARVNNLIFVTSPAGQLLLASSSSLEKTSRLWDPLTGEQVRGPRVHATEVSSLGASITPGGGLMLVTGHADGMLRLWDPLAPTPRRRAGHARWVESTAAVTAPDGRLAVATGGGDSLVRVWDAHTQQLVGTPLAGHPGLVTSVALATAAEGGKAGEPSLLLASGSTDRTVRLWHPLTGAPAGPPLQGHSGTVRSVAFGTGAEGHLWLASAGDDRTVRVWDPGSCTPAGGPLTGHTDWVAAVGFGTTASGRLLLASASGDATVRVWDPLTGQPAGPPLTGHKGGVCCLALTLAGGRLLLASGGEDETIRLWDAEAGRPTAELTAHAGWVQSLAFITAEDSPSLLLSGGGDKTVRVWDLTSGRLLRTLPRRSAVRSLATAGCSVAIGDGGGLTVVELNMAHVAAREA